jgi:hypothetical protein
MFGVVYLTVMGIDLALLDPVSVFVFCFMLDPDPEFMTVPVQRVMQEIAVLVPAPVPQQHCLIVSLLMHVGKERA